MNEFAVVSDTNPDIGFGLRIKDGSKIPLAKQLAKIGYAAWTRATDSEHWEDDYGTEYFTEDAVEGFYNAGYQEPADILLDKFGIEHEFVTCFDEDGEVIQDDVIWY